MSDTNITGKITVRELKKTDWPHIETLFGAKGACGGCWCMSWRIASHGKVWQAACGDPNRRAMKKLVSAGKALGVLAFDGNTPVGWCSFGRRADFPRTESIKAYHRDNITGIWSINCFYLGKGYRGQGIVHLLADKAVEAITRRKGRIIEAYPTPLTKAGDKLPAAFSYTGPEIVFQRLGFKEIRRVSHSRPLYELAVK